MIFRALVPVFFALSLAPPAGAGATIRTPALPVPSGGSVVCVLSNTSAKKSIQTTVRMRDNFGNIANEVLLGLAPLGVNFRAINSVSFGYCEAELIKGRKKDLLITLCAMVGGDPAGCVNGT